MSRQFRDMQRQGTSRPALCCCWETSSKHTEQSLLAADPFVGVRAGLGVCWGLGAGSCLLGLEGVDEDRD